MLYAEGVDCVNTIDVGKRIAALRRKHGLTQEALGEMVGVTNKTVSRWENGHYMPDIALLPVLSDALRVSIHELLGGQELPEDVRAGCR